MGRWLGFILLENICVCFASIDFRAKKPPAISNDQGIHDHSSGVRVRIHCKPECPLAAVHRIKNLVTKEDIIGNVGIVRDA